MQIKAIASGIVQGVGYRFFCQRQARALQVTGYARNLPNGKVEILAQGEKKVLEKFLLAIKDGPSLARVDKLEVNWDNSEEEIYDNFLAY